MRQILTLVKKFMKSRNGWSNRIDSLSVFLHKAYENLDYDFHANGEYGVLAKLAKIQGLSTIFDVGANEGKWSLIASELFPQATIHSFEIVPQTFSSLLQNCGHRRNIVCYDIGLSDVPGTTTVFFSPDMNEVATCVPYFSERFHRYQPQKVEAKVSTGDIVCAGKGIQTIDLLKIDVEGYEHRVLKGFEGMLKKGQIRVIQFEYGYINIDTHFLLKDFYDYLEALDMKIGKVYPSYVDLREYRYSDENFYGPNYMAIHSSCKAIADALTHH